MTPKEAYKYAKKHGPSKEIREIACEDPKYACWYAKDIDKEPREDTRNAACKDPEYAYNYALWIDKESKENTRKAACKDPECAYSYAVDIDECPHEDTWKAVKNTEFEEIYKKLFNSKMKEEII